MAQQQDLDGLTVVAATGKPARSQSADDKKVDKAQAHESR